MIAGKACKIKEVGFATGESDYDQPMIKPLSGILIFWHILLLSAAFSGLLFSQQVPVGPPATIPQDSRGNSSDKNSSPATATKSAGGAAVSADYKIGPADVLKIQVWDEDKFSGTFTVDQDGKFVYPLVGEIVAGDLTTAQVKESVEKGVSKYVVRPRVDVTVQEVQSKKYYLTGLINHPGEYLLAVPTTILQAIIKAGGLQDFANAKKIYILRGSTRIPFNYKEVSQGKKMEQNVLLQPGDQIFIP
jgi:polysaccharide export outer membrane protein